MRRPKLSPSLSLSRKLFLQALIALSLIYIVVFLSAVFTPTNLGSASDPIYDSSPARLLAASAPSHESYHRFPLVSSLVFRPGPNAFSYSMLDVSAGHAWELGRKLFQELQHAPLPSLPPNHVETCNDSILLSGEEIAERKGVMILPCGLAVGSQITLVGQPRYARPYVHPRIRKSKENRAVNVSEFVVELQGLNSVDGEEPPKIFHFNARLKGDWSGQPSIEHNTCYRMHWGAPFRCNGSRSAVDDRTVDGLMKCEEWIPAGDRQEIWSARKLFNHLDGNLNEASADRRYPFEEGKLFSLTLTAGSEGYHVAVDGRHVSSFPYLPAFALEDATGLVSNGDLDIQSVHAELLPTSHPRFSAQSSLQMLPEWQAPPLPDEPVKLFIGIISAGNHFTERMAVRQTWMSSVRNSSNVVARFFVALDEKNGVNIELKREAEFFGDIVIVPYMDSYDLLVFKTAAICEFGVRAVSAKYMMKCDDDTFVRVDTLLDDLNDYPSNQSVYVGKMNVHHRAMRSGKWAVTYEEWQEEEYPPYANGPGYIISNDIAQFIVSEFENGTLELFRMEDVSMGMWVEEFNHSKLVEYLHSTKFCQFGCIEGYLTAHYQSPRQMMCLWDKLQAGNPQCCNKG